MIILVKENVWVGDLMGKGVGRMQVDEVDGQVAEVQRGRDE